MKTGFTLVVTVILSGLFSVVSFYEAVRVFFISAEDYPFGSEGSAPWYYRTAETYAMYCLVYGVVFLIPLFLAVWSYKRKKAKGMRVALLLTFALIGLSYIMAFE